MRSLSALAFRNLWVRKARTLLTTVGIVLGVALILTTSVAAHSAKVSVRRLFEEAAGCMNGVTCSLARPSSPGSWLLSIPPGGRRGWTWWRRSDMNSRRAWRFFGELGIIIWVHLWNCEHTCSI
jgi:hypothetical protein